MNAEARRTRSELEKKGPSLSSFRVLRASAFNHLGEK